MFSSWNTQNGLEEVTQQQRKFLKMATWSGCSHDQTPKTNKKNLQTNTLVIIPIIGK